MLDSESKKYFGNVNDHNRFNIFSPDYLMTPLKKMDKKRKFEKQNSKNSKNKKNKLSDEEEGEEEEVKISQEEIEYKNFVKSSKENRKLKSTSLKISQEIEDYKECKSLSVEQLSALKSIFNLSNHSFWICGGSKTGKSTTLKALSRILLKNNISFVFLTGTIDSLLEYGTSEFVDFEPHLYTRWAGFDSIKKKEKKLIRDALNQYKKWINPEVMIIDNAAFVNEEYLSIFDKILRILKQEPDLPFGGTYLVVASDPAQEPELNELTFRENKTIFFESKIWKELNFQICPLTKDFYHSPLIEVMLYALTHPTSDKLIDKIDKVLNPDSTTTMELKERTSDEIVAKLTSFFKAFVESGPKISYIPELKNITNYHEDVKFEPKIIPISVSSVNKDEISNKAALKKIQSNANLVVEFSGHDYIENLHLLNPEMKSIAMGYVNCLKSSHVPKTLNLCTGAQVLLLEDVTIDNKNKKVENKDAKKIIKKGSQGIIVNWSVNEHITSISSIKIRLPVVKFMDYDEPVEVKPYEWTFTVKDIFAKDDDDDESNLSVISYWQIPLTLGWYVNIYKHPQLAVDDGYINTETMLDARQFYNCLTKCRNNVSLQSFNPAWLDMDKRITDFYVKNKL